MVREARYRQAGKRKSSPPMPTNREIRRTVRLVCCVGIVLAAVGIKLLFPDFINGLRNDALAVIGGSVDYESALSVMGEAVAGDKGFREAMTEAYEYAFTITNGDDAIEAAVTEETEAEPKGEKETEKKEKAEETTAIRNLTYIHAGEAAPPEGASYAMMQMNIEYCMPVSGTLTSSFGYREHPVDGGTKFHYGTDFGGEEGTDIMAFSDGTVYAVGESSTLGLYVMIDHADGVRTLYGHLSDVTVSGGDEVKIGEKIAEMGSTGNATASCLHFEIEVNGISVDPEYYLTWV